MDGATLIGAIEAGGNLGILALGLAVLDVRGRLADIRRRLDVIEMKQEAR